MSARSEALVIIVAASLFARGAWANDFAKAAQPYKVTVNLGPSAKPSSVVPASTIPGLVASPIPRAVAPVAANAPVSGPERVAQVVAGASELVSGAAKAMAAPGGSDESVSRSGQNLADLRPSAAVDAGAPADAALAASIKANAAIVNEARAEISKVIEGQKEVIDLAIVGLLTNRGHVLLEGMPGLGKTKLVETVSTVSGLTSQRIQFRPDIQPADIGGFKDEMANKIKWGPITKAQIIQADEINRGMPRAKAALLQPMQEGKVTIDDETKKLADPFLVLATMNPIDTEGVQPLLEPEKDRFLLSAFVDYPTDEEEGRIADEQAKPESEQYQPRQILNTQKIQELRRLIATIKVEPHMNAYARRIVRATRPQITDSGIDLKGNVTLGASPRASISMLQVARVYAFLAGRAYVNADDVQKAALPVLRHRIKLSSTGIVNKIRPEEIIAEILRTIKTPLPQR